MNPHLLDPSWSARDEGGVDHRTSGSGRFGRFGTYIGEKRGPIWLQFWCPVPVLNGVSDLVIQRLSTGDREELQW